MINLWIGGMICYALVCWRDWRRGLPASIYDIARARPVRFFASLAATIALWPITMVALVAIADTERPTDEGENTT